jgi:hypothetical protein
MQVPLVDRRFFVHKDGSVDTWALTGDGSRNSIAAGVTISPAGVVTVHEPPSSLEGMVTGGAYALSVSTEGALFQTTDHGRSWQSAGVSPVGPSAFTGGCSRLGCVFGGFVRVGWRRDSRVAVRVDPMPEDPPRVASRPRLVCAPTRGPDLSSANDRAPRDRPSAKAGRPRNIPPEPEPTSRVVVQAGYGDTIEILRETGSEASPTGKATPAVATPSPAPSGPPPPGSVNAPIGKGASPPGRTHTLVYRPPFAPKAAARRVNATDASFTARRPAATPLLRQDGTVALLLYGEGGELFVDGEHATSLPLFDGRRSSFYNDVAGPPGLVLPGGRALVLGDVRRRLALEEHGPPPQRTPFLIGVDRDQLRRRPMALARREDGSLGVMVFDGDAPQGVSIAVLDRAGSTIRAVEVLAPWSSVVSGADARCKADRDAWRVLVPLNPAAWLSLDPTKLPGIDLGVSGMALARWGKERVCLDAVDVAVMDNRRGETPSAMSVVVRFAADAKREAARSADAALRARDLSVDLQCSIEPPGAAGR